MPIDFQLSDTVKDPVPPFRGGILVEFRAERLQAYIGRISYRVEGETVPADLSNLNVRVGDETLELAVGRGGEFYLENVPAGTYPARLFNDKLDCRFELTIPESEETLIDLGEVYCETN